MSDVARRNGLQYWFLGARGEKQITINDKLITAAVAPVLTRVGASQLSTPQLLNLLQLLNDVAEFGGAFVEFFRDRGFHLALHDLEFGTRTFGAHFIEPFLEEMDLGTFRGQFGKVRLLKELGNGVASAADLGDRFRKFPLP